MKSMQDEPTFSSGPAASLLTVVVPIYNEAACLANWLAALVPHCRERNWKLVLVDDGSSDGTPAILEKYTGSPDVSILRHKLNRGYGGALKTGLLHVETPYALTIDADGQHELADIQALLDLALEKNADMVVGRRNPRALPGIYRSIGRWLIRRFAGLLMPIHISDLNSGFKLYDSGLVQRYASICPDSMAFSDVITLIFIKKRHLVLEKSITIQRRAGGKSTINTFTAFQTVMEIINIAMLFNPLRIFLPLALFFVVGGLAWGIPIMLQGRGVSVGAMLAIVTGLLCFFFGLIAEQLSAMRMGLLDADQEYGKE